MRLNGSGRRAEGHTVALPHDRPPGRVFIMRCTTTGWFCGGLVEPKTQEKLGFRPG
jgi:hypothetical protein